MNRNALTSNPHAVFEPIYLRLLPFINVTNLMSQPSARYNPGKQALAAY